MKKTAILIFVLLFTNPTFSQNIQKAYKYMETNNFEKALEIFRKALDKKKEPIAAKFGMALIYQNEKYKKKSLLKSYRYMKYVEKKLKKAKNKSELEKNYNITQKAVSNYKNIISEKSYKKIKKKNSIDAINRYLKKFGDSEYAKPIERKRDSTEFEKIQDKNDYWEFQKYFLSYPKSYLVPKAKKEFERLWKKLYEDIAWYGEYEILMDFESKYPDYPFYDSYTEKNKSVARMGKYLRLERKYQASKEQDYKKYIEIAAPKELSYIALIKLIEPNLEKEDYEGAIKILQENKIHFKNKTKRIDKLIKILETPETGIEAEGISENINSDAWEYSASITADGKQIYFCGRNRENNLVERNEDIFKSVYENGEWSEAVLVEGVNTPHNHEAPTAISGDGNRMLLFSNADIFYIDKKPEGWTKKMRLSGVNESSWEADAMQTYDGNAVLFASDRKGNIGDYHEYTKSFHGMVNGNTDIYVFIKSDAAWSEPINLGTIINTAFTERSPFLHSDMKTLYFCSDGHGGLGRLDVFMSKRLSDTSWTQWSEPVNLGKEMNTPADEYGYKISTDGKTAYFSSYQNGGFDIFTIELPKKLRPETVTTISGTIKDRNNNLLYADIKWENLETGEIIGSSKSNPENGEYIIVLPNGKNYGYFVSKNGYYFNSGNINLTETAKIQEITKDIILISKDDIINNNISILLENLFFEHDKYFLKPESYPELNRLVKFLKENSEFKAEISGHTDNVGAEKYNKTLSLNRAKSVKNYLVKQGCNPNKLTAKGYGQAKPIDTNKTESGRAKNRRVEIRFKK